MNVAVLILSWNAVDATLACLASAMQQEHLPERVLVVDNASDDDTVAHVQAQFPAVELIQNVRNLGFAAGMNVGLRALQAALEPPEIVLLLNQDTILTPSCVDAVLAPFADAQVGAVGCKILYPDGTLQHAGAYLEWPRAVAQHVGWHERDTGQYDTERDFDTLTGAALALRMGALDAAGLFDEGYTPGYYEDTDLCWRLQHAGYRIVYAPRAVLQHHESLSIRDALQRSKYYNRGRLRFVLKTYAWADIVGSFAQSELAFIHTHGYGAEARALRWAYVATFAHLSDILQARMPLHGPLDPPQISQLRALLVQFKRTLALALHARAETLITRMYAQTTSNENTLV